MANCCLRFSYFHDMPDNNTVKKDEQNNIMSQQLMDGFKYFLTCHDPNKISRNLMYMFLDYLKHQFEFLPADFVTTISGLHDLLELLNLAEDETKDWKRE